MHHFTKTDLCPECGSPFDMATNTAGKGGPKPGDFTICFQCATILQFDASLITVIPPDDWHDGVHPNTGMALLKAQAAVKQIRSALPPPTEDTLPDA